MTDIRETLSETPEKLGAVAPILHVRSDAHLLEEEMVAIARPFAMTEREADNLNTSVEDADAC